MNVENKVSIQADLSEELSPGIALLTTALTLIVLCEKIGRIRRQA